MKKTGVALLALAMALAVPANAAFAEGDGYGKGYGKSSLEHKVYKKVKMIKHHQEQLGFSDQDVQKALDLKTSLKKDLIKLNADLDTVKVDLKKVKYADTPDVRAYNSLIDRKYDIKKEKAKRVFQAYADVKGMFSAEQRAKLKELYAAKMKDGKYGKCPACLKLKDGKCPECEKKMRWKSEDKKSDKKSKK